MWSGPELLAAFQSHKRSRIRIILSNAFGLKAYILTPASLYILQSAQTFFNIAICSPLCYFFWNDSPWARIFIQFFLSSASKVLHRVVLSLLIGTVLRTVNRRYRHSLPKESARITPSIPNGTFSHYLSQYCRVSLALWSRPSYLKGIKWCHPNL